jgi:hypothetical protein
VLKCALCIRIKPFAKRFRPLSLNGLSLAGGR